MYCRRPGTVAHAFVGPSHSHFAVSRRVSRCLAVMFQAAAGIPYTTSSPIEPRPSTRYDDVVGNRRWAVFGGMSRDHTGSIHVRGERSASSLRYLSVCALAMPRDVALTIVACLGADARQRDTRHMHVTLVCTLAFLFCTRLANLSVALVDVTPHTPVSRSPARVLVPHQLCIGRMQRWPAAASA